MATAIREMHVLGAGLIGASAGFAMYLAAIEAALHAELSEFNRHMARAAAQLEATRPTAVNLSRAVERQLRSTSEGKTAQEKSLVALGATRLIAAADEENWR